MPSALEQSFAFTLKALGIEMIQQHKFHPDRKWRMDFAHLESKTGIEIDGGEFLTGKKAGAHNRGSRMANDYEKRNAAIELGWVVFQLTGAMVTKNPAGWAKRIQAVIEERLA